MNSLIVPVYNSRRTINRLVNSVPPDWELILVEDGSTEPIIPPDRAVYIKQTNQGPGAARNTGLQHATGDYVFFADADDELIPVDWEPYLNHDMVYAGYIEVGNGYERQLWSKPTGCVYSVAYRRKFLIDNDIWFPPFMQMEDIAFNTICQGMSDDWASLNGCTYKYIVTQGSITQTRDFNKTGMPYHVKSDIYVYNYFKTRNPEFGHKRMVMALSYYYYSLMAMHNRMTDDEIKEFLDILGEWARVTHTLDDLTDFEKYAEVNKKYAIKRLGQFSEPISMDDFIEFIRSKA